MLLIQRFAERSYKNNKTRSMFQLNESSHTMDLRKQEKFKVINQEINFSTFLIYRELVVSFWSKEILHCIKQHCRLENTCWIHTFVPLNSLNFYLAFNLCILFLPNFKCIKDIQANITETKICSYKKCMLRLSI